MNTAADPKSRAEQGRFRWGRLVFLGLAAVLAVGCPAQTPAPPDAGAVDAGPSPAQAACEAAGEPCRAFVWQGGQCVPKVLVGAVCGEVAGACTVGVCDEAGQCTGKQPAAVGKVCAVVAPAACQKWLGRCDSGGNCIPEVFEGATCKVGNGPCAGAGKCNDQGQCVAGPVQGTSCQLNEGPCGKGICDAQGKCASTVTGQPCSAKVGQCEVALCDANGACTAQPQPAGTACKVSAPKGCESTSGKCDAAAKCVANIAVGEGCKVGGNVCSLGTCNAQGGCDATEFAVAGTSCGPNVGCGTPTCDGKGACVVGKAAIGTPCGVSIGLSCAKYACDAAGQCALAPNPGAACFALADPQGASCSAANHCFSGVCGGEIGKCEPQPQPGKACKAAGECTTGVCSAAGSCEQVPVAAGKACKSTLVCNVGVCDGGGLCTQVPIADGVPCDLPTGSDPACASAACLAGKCVLAAKTGKSCGKQPCKAGVCSEQGVCEFSPTPGVACGPEGQCTASLCDAAGQCTVVAKPGASCSSGPCHAGTCSAEGKCNVQVKVGAACQDKGLCGDGLCTAQGECVSPAYPKPSECHVSTSSVLGECWAGVVNSSGACTKVARVGAACGCWVSPCSMGTCQADGSCLQKPSKPAGTPCSSDCVTDGVCTSAGKCSGTVAVGKYCSDGEEYGASYYCRHPRCQADGDCGQIYEPAGTPCADAISTVVPSAQAECGQFDKCDGKGHCMAKYQATDGTPCGTLCGQGRTCFMGHCLGSGTKPSNTPCGLGCLVGKCLGGMCVKSDAASDMNCDDGNSCTKDVCCGADWGYYCSAPYAGKCEHHVDQLSCGESGCWIGMCDQPSGACVTKKMATGTPCYTDGCGMEYTCFAGECHPATYFGGSDPCDDGNVCTADACSNCGCSHGVSPYLEGLACPSGGHCLKGNCVPD